MFIMENLTITIKITEKNRRVSSWLWGMQQFIQQNMDKMNDSIKAGKKIEGTSQSKICIYICTQTHTP